MKFPKHEICALFASLALTVLPCVAGDAIPAGLDRAIEPVTYRLDPSGHNIFHGANPAQRLALDFNSGGARLRHARGDTAFHLRGYGYGEHLRAPAETAPIASGSRVEYRRGELTEWYTNESRGLEQGFTFSRRPGDARQTGEPLTIALALDGQLTAALAPDGDAVLLESGGQTVLRYSGLHSWDARGRQVPSHLRVAAHEVRLLVDDRNAEYPLTVDPLWTQQAYFAAGSGVDGFGDSVSVSGNWVAVGAPYTSGVGANGLANGAVYLYHRDGTTWTKQAYLTPPVSLGNENFGWSVSLDGNHLAVGAPGINTVFLFTHSGPDSSPTWSLTINQTLPFALSNGNALFGYSVAVAGNLLVVGAPHLPDNNPGEAHVIFLNDPSWSNSISLHGENQSSEDHFGVSVATDGFSVVVGGPNAKYPPAATVTGAAWVFSGPDWTASVPLVPTDSIKGTFGSSVAVSGGTVVVGAFADNRIYIYTHRIATGRLGPWKFTQEFSDCDSSTGTLPLFGTSVATNGTMIVAGGPQKNTGHACVFYNNGTGDTFEGLPWAFQQELTPNDIIPAGGQAPGLFGKSVSLSGATIVSSTPLQGGPNGSASPGVIYVDTAQSEVGISPINGVGTKQTFTVSYSGKNGPGDLLDFYLVFGPTQSVAAPNSCIVAYNPATNAFHLVPDNGAGILPAPVYPGGGTETVANSQCVLSTAAGNYATTSEVMTVPFTLTFAAPFWGTQSVWAFAQNKSGDDIWQSLGTWVTGPTALSVSPSTGSGLGPRTFIANYYDPKGVSDILQVYLDFGTAAFAPHGCIATYTPATQTMALFADNGLLAGQTQLNGIPLSNSECTVSFTQAAIAGGNNVAVPFTVTFSSGFEAGPQKHIFGYVENTVGVFSPGLLLGTWTP